MLLLAILQVQGDGFVEYLIKSQPISIAILGVVIWFLMSMLKDREGKLKELAEIIERQSELLGKLLAKIDVVNVSINTIVSDRERLGRMFEETTKDTLNKMIEILRQRRKDGED